MAPAEGTTPTPAPTPASDHATEENARLRMSAVVHPNDPSPHAMSTAIFMCLVASIVEFSTAADFCANHPSPNGDCHDDGHATFAVVVGVLSAVYCIVWICLRYFAKVELQANLELALSVVLVCLWAAGAGVNTSVEGPFSATGNGYFATWFALIFAVLYAAHAYVRAVKTIHTTVFHHAITFILIGSIVEMCVSIDICADKDCNNRENFALAAGVISTILVLMQIAIAHFARHEVAQTSGRIVGGILVVLWGFAAAFSTSTEGPYSATCRSANGYFSTWLAFVASVLYAFRILVEDVRAEDA